jgi:hypothetical protein
MRPVVFPKLRKRDPNESPAEYMRVFKQHARECIRNAYQMENTVSRRSSSGYLTTSLAEDVVSLIDTQRSVLKDYLKTSELWTRQGNEICVDGLTQQGNTIYIDCLLYIFGCLLEEQHRNRPLFLVSLEECCAAANDFLRLSEKFETLLEQLLAEAPLFIVPDSREAAVRNKGSAYILQLSQDSVYAAERAQVFIMRAVNQTMVPSNLFTAAWEDDFTNNELISHLIRTVDGFLLKIEEFLATDTLYNKALIITCKAIVCFYVRCLVEKADSVSRRRRNRGRIGMLGERKPFRSPKRALIRMFHDIRLIKEYFVEKASAPMTRIIKHEVYVLEVIHECLDADDANSLENFILIIHKRTGSDMLVTQHLVGDLWLLVANEAIPHIGPTLTHMQPDLQMVTQATKQRQEEQNLELSWVSIDEVLRSMYEDRIVQGALPICWACLPKIEQPIGNAAVGERVRAITRTIKEKVSFG